MSSNKDIKENIKATSLFGGVQVFSILVSIVRSKVVALLIGPAGVGVVELFSSTIRLIGSLTNFSLQTSAVREVSIAYKSGDKNKFRHVVSLFSKIVWITGLLGTIVCLLGSPLWSKLSFGNYGYTLAFAILSCVLLLNQLYSGKNLLLQSTRHFKYIAYSGVIGNVLGLITTIPIYYIWGVDGIVAVLILAAFFPFVLSNFFTSKLNFEYEPIGLNTVVKEGTEMLKQGFLLSVNFLFSSLIFYILRIFISNQGGTVELGLYSAAFAIVHVYVGMVIKSMSQEYYPRISSLSMKPKEFNDAVDKQIFLSLLLLGPLVALFLTFSNELLLILYSDKFSGAAIFMALSMLGIIFQAPSSCLGYVYLAKGDNKTFLTFETIAKVQKLSTDILFYFLWGLTGIGVSFIISYLYYLLQSLLVCNRRYRFVLTKQTIILLVAFFSIGLIILIVITNLPFVLGKIVGVIAIIISCCFSYIKLDKLIGISSFIKRKFIKK